MRKFFMIQQTGNDPFKYITGNPARPGNYKPGYDTGINIIS